MDFFALLLTDRYGDALPANLRPLMALIAIVVSVGVLVLWAVNRKKLEQIDQAYRSKQPPTVGAGVSWKCPRCGEKLEAQFASCWKCRENP